MACILLASPYLNPSPRYHTRAHPAIVNGVGQSIGVALSGAGVCTLYTGVDMRPVTSMTEPLELIAT